MDLHLKIIGILLTGIASVHAAFPKYFNWKQELNSVSLINRQLMYVHSFFIAFVVLLIGLLCLTSTTDMWNSEFGKRISLGLAIFWTARLVFQFCVYSSKLWRGKKFETLVHIGFSFVWIYITTIFFLIYLGK